MKGIKRNLPLAIGLILISLAHIINHSAGMPDALFRLMMISGMVFELWGVVLVARSPEMKNSKLRQWKMKLIGRAER